MPLLSSNSNSYFCSNILLFEHQDSSPQVKKYSLSTFMGYTFTCQLVLQAEQ